MFRKLMFIFVSVAYIQAMEVTSEELFGLLKPECKSDETAIAAVTKLTPVQLKLLGALIKNDAQMFISFFKESSEGQPQAFAPIQLLFSRLIMCDNFLDFNKLCAIIMQLQSVAAIDPSLKATIDKALEGMIVEGAQWNCLDTVRFLLKNGVKVPDIYIQFDGSEGHLFPLDAAALRKGYQEMFSLLHEVQKNK
jgi:hypothetical protein